MTGALRSHQSGFERYVLSAPLLALLAVSPAIAQDGFLEVSLGRDQAFERVFNPFLGDAMWPANAGVYEPLLVFNRATSRYLPWLATAHEWASDHRSLRFELRDGVSWSDGEAFDAADVVFTFELLRAHDDLDAAGVWGFLESVERVGPLAVQFRFARLFTPGLLALGSQPIVPEHRWRSVSDPGSIPNPYPVATGPFTEVRSLSADVYEIGRHPYYWQEGKPALAGLRVRRYETNEEIEAAFDEGRLDWASLFREDVEGDWVATNPSRHQYWYPDLGATALMLLNAERAPFGDPRVRKAVSLAIDRVRMTDEALRGYAAPADVTGLADSQRRWKDPSLRGDRDWTRHDPAAAARLLGAAGLRVGGGGTRMLGDGRPFRFVLNVVDGWSDWLIAAEIVKAGLAEVGVEVSIEPLSYADWMEALSAGRYDAGFWFGDRGPTPYEFYAGQLGGRSAEADALLRSFESTTDVDRLLAVSYGLQQLYAELAPTLPLYPGPLWGVYSLERFTGFPSRFRPYGSAVPAGTDALPVLVDLVPR